LLLRITKPKITFGGEDERAEQNEKTLRRWRLYNLACASLSVNLHLERCGWKSVWHVTYLPLTTGNTGRQESAHLTRVAKRRAKVCAPGSFCNSQSNLSWNVRRTPVK
jgi:hypothetical protein